MNRWFALCILFGINAMNFYDRQSMGSERFGHGLVEHRLYFVLCGRRGSAGTIGGSVETHPDPEHWSYCLESAHGRLRFCLELLVSFYHAAGSGNGGSDMCAC